MDPSGIGEQDRGSGALPDALMAAFDAFEAIRAAARDCEDRAPEAFGAFMMAAGAAVEGRNAVTAAPSFPYAADDAERFASLAITMSGGGVDDVANGLAALAAVIGARLSSASSLAADAQDKAHCAQAAAAAREICDLLGQGNDAADIR